MAERLPGAGAGSQTLARGLRALALIGETDPPMTVVELAEELGIHRSMAYRLVQTLESYGFVERAATGELAIGPRLASIARGAARDLQAAASRELEALADDLGMTTFLVVFDGEAAVTLISCEPRDADATVAQRPGSRHSIEQGAPGRVIRSLLDPTRYPPKPYETSSGEIIPGLSAVAVPLRVPRGRPAAISVIGLAQPINEAAIAARLNDAADRISRDIR